MLDVREAIEAFKDFDNRCAKRDKQINRIKEDREFLSGKQWDKTDDILVPKNRGRRTVNVIANSVNSVANQYANYPYKWYSSDEEIDGVCNAFLKAGSNSRAAYDALYSSVAFGIGYLALGSEMVTDTDGTQVSVPALYAIDKLENVMFDVDSIEMDGGDAVEAAILEFRSKNYIQAKYGSQWVTDRGVPAIVNVRANKDPDQMVIVTYFKVEDGKCSIYRMLNNDFLEEPVQIDIDRVPVFPCYGERTWDDDEIIWQGLVRKSAPIQKLINYAYTQLGERMAIAPKPVWMTTGEAIEGYQENWKYSQYNLNQLLIRNDTSADGKIEYPEPKRFDNTVQFGDITGIIESNLGLMSTITGVDAKGIMDAPAITATEVNYNERQVQCTTRHYFANLRDTFKAVGETLLQILNYGKVNLEVIQGPQEYMQQQIARAELVQLAGLVPEQNKMQIVDGILLSHNDNPVLRNVFGAIHQMPAPTAMEQQAIQTAELMKQKIDELTQQNAMLEEQVKRYELNADNADKNLQADFAKAEMEHKFKQEDMILQAQLDNGLDADKAAVDVQKAQMDLESKAIQLDTQKVKAAAEIAKATQPQTEVIYEDRSNA